MYGVQVTDRKRDHRDLCVPSLFLSFTCTPHIALYIDLCVPSLFISFTCTPQMGHRDLWREQCVGVQVFISFTCTPHIALYIDLCDTEIFYLYSADCSLHRYLCGVQV